MDYEEFMWARGNDSTLSLLKDAFVSKAQLGEQTNRRLMRDFRLYMLVGGMPQIVDTYLQTNNLQEVDGAKRMIINLYEEVPQDQPIGSAGTSLRRHTGTTGEEVIAVPRVKRPCQPPGRRHP